MKIVSISLALLLTLLLSSASADEQASGGGHSCCASHEAAVVESAHLSDNSLYQLDSTWTNDSGAAVKLASLRGRSQIIVMFFANCSYACPLLVFQIKQIEAALPKSVRDGVGFTLVSFDSVRDTPAALRRYRLLHELQEQRWTLLQGNPEDVRDLAALLNVKFKKDDQGQFLHSNVISLLNAQGELSAKNSA